MGKWSSRLTGIRTSLLKNSLNMSDAKIASAGVNYYLALDLITKRRQQWDEQVKNLIRNTLNSCVILSRIPLEVNFPVEYRNHESVMVFFPDERGVYIHPFQGEAEVVKTGAQLIFQQLKNGNIIAVSIMPTLEGIGVNSEQEFYDLVEHEPSEMTYELIAEYFIKFIDSVRQWELSRISSAMTQIGF